MPLTQSQIQEIKKQLLSQINHLPSEQKEQAINQINNLTEKQMEALLEEQKSKPQNNKGIFRMIADHEVKSYIIEENSFALAVLDIKPISKGHIIIVPKKAISDVKHLPSPMFTLAKKLAKKISLKLKTEGAEIQTEFKFGEIVVNVIPIYGKSLNINSPRTNPEEKELEEVYRKLRTIKKPKIEKIKKKTGPKENILKLNRRIP